MNVLVYHVVAGHSFFTGIMLVILAAIFPKQATPDDDGPNPTRNRLSGVSFLIGSLAIAISSAAISYWLYALAAATSVAWVASRCVDRWRWTAHAMIAVWLIAGAVELPFHFAAELKPASSRTITVIGDSVTAGVGRLEDSERWPGLLSAQHDLQIQDVSHVGETATSALKRVKTLQIESSVIIVEIGGNDLLGATTVGQFSEALDVLLEQVRSPGRQIVMLELPLPPFHNEYGRVQRQLAWKHNVVLVPRRVFLSVLAADESTLDTIHLSRDGHERMAESIWQLVRSAFADSGE
jgi:acyl-CoA thioesterase-1